MARLYVTCPKCSHRSDRAGGRRKCQGCGAPLPKRRVPKHATVLRDTPYDAFVQIAWDIHGAIASPVHDADACCVCGRPPSDNRRHDRDHDHRTGRARGLACVRCNRELLRNTTLEEARLVVAYLERVEAHYEAVRAAVSA